MARTVASVAGRGERGAGKKVRRERVEAGKGLEENMLGGREENLVEILGEGQEGGSLGGGGKRVRKATNHFQFGSAHTLFSETSAKYKSKTVAVVKSREKRRKNYKKKHFVNLKREVKELKSIVKRQAMQLKAKSKKDKKSLIKK